ncbi:YveK family protein [Peribacillus sp. NPDC097198]|uniref:YveK family protein n=1 Tax=Peribacillus sp. NPDC097198 TaxID=3364397 RepID=UPI00381C42F8
MGETVSIKEIYIFLKKRWKLVMLTTLLAVLISGSVTYFILTPVYQASTQILVNQKNAENPIDVTQLQSNIDLINTYSVIIKSPAILEKTIENLELTQSVEELNRRITINSQENSQVFSLTVEDSNANKAVEIANNVSETFQKEIKGIMNVDNVNILAKAEYKDSPIPSKPKPLLNIAIAIVIGMLVGMAWALLLEYSDSTLKDDQDIESYLGLPVLGSIQKIPQKKIPQ